MSERQYDPSARYEVGKRHHDHLADDIMYGVEAIAAFMGLQPRQVYHLQKRLPVFKMGATICARKSTLLAWIAAQEGRAGQ